jgi:nitroreductase
MTLAAFLVPLPRRPVSIEAMRWWETAMAERRLDAGPDILHILGRRWSPRAWADRPVEAEKIVACLEAARWAASSGNQQPWHFIVATQDRPDAHRRLLSCVSADNARWACRAPVLMLSVARKASDTDAEPNRYAWHDTGLATAGLMTQATALGLHVRAMGSYSRTKARETFGIPEGFDPVAALAMGYVGDPDTLPTDLRTEEVAPRSRRPMTVWVFEGVWGRPSALVG